MAYPLPTLAATIDASGISAPSYSDILESIKAKMRSIYGSDVYLEADSQDGQYAALWALSIADCNDAAIAAFNNMSPLTALGEGLSSVVKINGIARHIATKSTVVVRCNGEIGVTITNGKVRDQNGQTWILPSPTVIGSGGYVDVTATAEVAGALTAAAHTVNIIGTPTGGWNSVDNAAAAVVGAPVETDAQLRRRQADSVANNGTTIIGRMTGAVKALTGVQQARVYENKTGSTDANGIPAHSVAVVVFGGVNTEIADAIMDTRSPGVNMYGTTTVNRTDDVGVVQAIKFSLASQVTIKVDMEVHALTGYTTTVGDKIKAALVAYFNSLPIGDNVYWARTFQPALLVGDPDQYTFEINFLKLYRDADPHLQDDVAIAFNELPRGILANITLAVV